MIYLLFGPPGVGKGTQGARIAHKYAVPIISTGEIFRNLAAAGTPLGRAAKEFTSKGELVPDEIVVALVQQRIAMADCADGFLLDGFPRTINQAEILECTLDDMGLELNGVLSFEACDGELIRRLTGRRTCSRCGATYHIRAMPPTREGICDRCGGELVQRADDTEEAIRTRLREYEAKTAPLLSFYRKRGLLRSVDAAAAPDTVAARAAAVLAVSHGAPRS